MFVPLVIEIADLIHYWIIWPIFVGVFYAGISHSWESASQSNILSSWISSVHPYISLCRHNFSRRHTPVIIVIQYKTIHTSKHWAGRKISLLNHLICKPSNNDHYSTFAAEGWPSKHAEPLGSAFTCAPYRSGLWLNAFRTAKGGKTYFWPSARSIPRRHDIQAPRRVRTSQSTLPSPQYCPLQGVKQLRCLDNQKGLHIEKETEGDKERQSERETKRERGKICPPLTDLSSFCEGFLWST